MDASQKSSATEARPSTSLVDAARPSDVRPSTSDTGTRASADNTSTNNPQQSNANKNAAAGTTEPKNSAAGNVFVRFYRRLFHRKRGGETAAAATASAESTPSENVNVNNVTDQRPAQPPPVHRDPTRSTSGARPTSGQFAGARAFAAKDNDQFDEEVDDNDDSEFYDDDDDDVDDDTTGMTDSENADTEYTRLLRRRRQPLPNLSQLCRTSFQARGQGGRAWRGQPGGEAWASRGAGPYARDHNRNRKSPPRRRRYNPLPTTSSD